MAWGGVHSSSFYLSSVATPSSSFSSGASGKTCMSSDSIYGKQISAISSKQSGDMKFLSLHKSITGDVKDWCDVYSLKSLKLTLEDILDYCRVQCKNILVEFPFFHYLKALDKIDEIQLSPSRPRTHVDKTRLSQKKKELKLLVRFYEDRIHWLTQCSRKYFGLVGGHRVAVVIEASDYIFSLRDGSVMMECKFALGLLVDEQLSKKDVVYCISYGSTPSLENPQGYPFIKFKTHCVDHVKAWVANLQGESGNNLYGALKLSLDIKDLDTIFVILFSVPDQPLDVISSYMVDKLSGDNCPKLHLVAFRATPNVQAALGELAVESHGYYHSYSMDIQQLPSDSQQLAQVHNQQPGTDVGDKGSADVEPAANLVDDSDVKSVKVEITKARRILIDIESLKHDFLGHSLLQLLRQISLSIEWEEDDDFSRQALPTGSHCKVCSTGDWISQFGIEGEGLNLYKFLAPNAYPQLRDHVEVTNGTVVSQVYDVMPLIPWNDGSHKYLHVDVHGIDSYISTLKNFMVHRLLERLSWLQSGSRVPFGVFLESKVVVVVDSSYSVSGQILGLQQHLRMLLEEQLAHVKEFNLVGYGRECRLWTTGLAEPHRHSLLQAWEWILGISACGSSDLLSSLRFIFESGQVLKDCNELSEAVGIYLVISSLTDQTSDVLCSYLEQVLSGINVRVHVIFYNTEPFTGPSSFYPSWEGGRCGPGEEVAEDLKALAQVGRGRFHHFKVSGTCDGEDIALLVEEIDRAMSYLRTARKILEDYKEFCQRNIPPPCPNDTPCQSNQDRQQSLPLYPRQTFTSLARMNATINHKLELDHNQSHGQILTRKKKQKYIKDHFLYTGRGLNKVNAWELVHLSLTKKVKTESQIPSKEEHVTSEKWLSRYGMEELTMDFGFLVPVNPKGENSCSHPLNYKHINHQGEVVDLCVDGKGLKDYKWKLQKILARYRTRMQWLSEDYRKYFGAVTENKVLFLLDVSSSMSTNLTEMKEAVSLLLKHMPSKIKRFNFMAYSTEVNKWQTSLVTHTREGGTNDIMASAAQWMNSLKAGGSSYLLQAFRDCLESGAQGIYLMTDGSADHTHHFLLQQLPWLFSKFGTEWRVNTIGWYSPKNSQSFLRNLAHKTGGRFHCYPSLSEGDDHTYLDKEIFRAEDSLAQANKFK